MRAISLGLLLALCTASARAQANPFGPFTLGLAAGVADGPGPFSSVVLEGAARVKSAYQLGVEVGVLAARGECDPYYPTQRCQAGGTSLLLHARAAPSGASVAPLAGVLAGAYVRRGAGGFRSGSPALGGEVGLRLGDTHGWAVVLAGRYLRALDHEFDEQLGQPLAFRVVTLGAEFQFD